MTPDTITVKLVFEKLPANKIAPLQQAWVEAELPDGTSAELNCGAGLGNSALSFHVGGPDSRETYIASVSPLFHSLIASVTAE